MRVDPRQLDLFAPVQLSVPTALAEPIAIEPAPLLIPLANSGPWPGLSSRSWMHMFALQQHTDGRVYSIHPAFDDAPWLDAHAAALGYRPVYAECMSERRRQGGMRFAWEFCTTKGWRELLANQHLTTTEAIMRAVSDGVHRYQNADKESRLDYRTARSVMLKLGSKEPQIGSFSDADMIFAVVEQMFFRAKDLEELTWQRIHAWQLGLVKYQKGLAVAVEQRKAA